MIQEKLSMVERYFALPGTEFQRMYRPRRWCRENGVDVESGEGDHLFWALLTGEKYGKRTTFFGNSIEECLDRALAHFKRQGIMYGKYTGRRSP